MAIQPVFIRDNTIFIHRKLILLLVSGHIDNILLGKANGDARELTVEVARSCEGCS